MRTTLTIDDDVMEAAKAIAGRPRVSIGEVVSNLARQALRQPTGLSERNGVPWLPVTNLTAQVTVAVIDQLRDEAS